MNSNISIKFSSLKSRKEIFIKLNSYDLSNDYELNDSIVFNEDEAFNASVVFDHVPNHIKNIQLYLNGKNIGNNFECSTEDQSDDSPNYEFLITYKSNVNNNKPFLMLLDLISLKLSIESSEGLCEYQSDYYACASKRSMDTSNVQRMLTYLLQNPNSKPNQWIFGNKAHSTESNNISKEGVFDDAYNSLFSYTQLVENIIHTYSKYSAYFSTKAKNKLIKTSIIADYQKAKRISRSDFEWVVKNAHYFTKVDKDIGLTYKNSHYLPSSISSEHLITDRNIYENKVLMTFLLATTKQIDPILRKIEEIKTNLKNSLIRLRSLETISHAIPLINVLSFQQGICTDLHERLSKTYPILKKLVTIYKKILNCDILDYNVVPKMTKIFQEVKPYNQLFSMMILWLKFRNSLFNREYFLLSVNSVNGIFELYSYSKILEMLQNEGFELINEQDAITQFNYPVFGESNKQPIANTIKLQNDLTQITVYYEPVIHSKFFYNNITLYRTSNNNYFRPDFLLKFSHKSRSAPRYIIIDAKYTTMNNAQVTSLKDIAYKYGIQIWNNDSVSENTVKSIIILQGRMNNNTSPIPYHLHDSTSIPPLSAPPQSYSIFPLSSWHDSQSLAQIWSQIQEKITI